LDILEVRVLNRSGQNLPFNSFSNLDSVGSETLIEYRALAVRNEVIGNVFRVQAALLRFFRAGANPSSTNASVPRVRFLQYIQSSFQIACRWHRGRLRERRVYTLWEQYKRKRLHYSVVRIAAVAGSERHVEQLTRHP
jgi:hypothetical protein